MDFRSSSLCLWVFYDGLQGHNLINRPFYHVNICNMWFGGMILHLKKDISTCSIPLELQKFYWTGIFVIFISHILIWKCLTNKSIVVASSCSLSLISIIPQSDYPLRYKSPRFLSMWIRNTMQFFWYLEHLFMFHSSATYFKACWDLSIVIDLEAKRWWRWVVRRIIRVFQRNYLRGDHYRFLRQSRINFLRRGWRTASVKKEFWGSMSQASYDPITIWSHYNLQNLIPSHSSLSLTVDTLQCQ